MLQFNRAEKQKAKQNKTKKQTEREQAKNVNNLFIEEETIIVIKVMKRYLVSFVITKVKSKSAKDLSATYPKERKKQL